MDSSLAFSDQEIQEELLRLGYSNIPRDKLQEFQRDLNKLVQAERSRANTNSSFDSESHGGMKPEQEGFDGSPEDPTVRQLGKGSVDDNCNFPLTREDLDKHDQRQKERAGTTTKVPGHFSLFELPPSHLEPFRDDVSETDSEIRRMKRKTLRKNDQGAKFIDESMSDIDVASIGDAHERMQRMVLRDLDPVAPRRSQSARPVREPPPYRLGADDPRPPSVIYPSFDHPHTKNLRRADPVARYHQMHQMWSLQQAPGENQHKGLRWNVREQMLTQFVPEKKPQRKYVPNNYIPPPDKQRKALRWQIRMDMA